MKKIIVLALILAFFFAGCIAPEEAPAEDSDVNVEELDADINDIEEALKDLNELEDLEAPDINEELFE
jgi:PBP1b-binding outer membrane lipoprotein LpoB